MKTLIRKLCFIGVFLFVSFCFTGCMTTGGRLYSGDLRSNQEVAILVIHQDFNLMSFSGGGIDEKLINLKIAELIPDSYNLCVSYTYHAAGYSVTSDGCASRKINAQAGHVYYIHPVSDFVVGVEGEFTWSANIVDIASDADYDKVKEGNNVKNKVNDYLKGKRPEIN